MPSPDNQHARSSAALPLSARTRCCSRPSSRSCPWRRRRCPPALWRRGPLAPAHVAGRPGLAICGSSHVAGASRVMGCRGA
jgi:hypothetical protein